MDPFALLRFAHLIGLTLMGAGLIGVFVADMRSRQARDLNLFGQAVSLIGLFYDGLVVPGALLLLGSGTWMIVAYHGGWDFLEVPWLTGMVTLFAFEFIEGNTVTRIYFLRLRRLTRRAMAAGDWTPDLRAVRGEAVPSFTHFLDLPILTVIIALGALRPEDWATFAVGAGLALAVATALNLLVPRLYPWG
ncbi:MAG: DUF2269 family protein [Rhodobacterales bacterium]|nr:DUF2269 family protein [Rhodobacterales bacterium]